MYKSDFSGVLGLVIMSTSAAAMTGIIAEIEETLHDYSLHVGQLKWKWSLPKTVCDLLSPGDYFTVHAALGAMKVTLETVSCAQIIIEILDCIYKKNGSADSSEEGEASFTDRHFISGLNGEVYEMILPQSNSRCSDPLTPIIGRCVEDGENYTKDVSEIEHFFYRYRQVIGSRNWRALNPICELLCHDHFDFDLAQLDEATVMLESLNCKPMSMLVLDCYYEKQDNAPNGLIDEISYQYVRDGLGEVYEVSLPDRKNTGKCHDPTAFIIRRRVIDNRGRLARPLCYEPPRTTSPSRPPLPEPKSPLLS